jgi:outer membrane protein OmpA-like peptidoglycan-associated protein
VSTAVTPGAGAAAFRAFVGGGFGKVSEPAPVDTDGDGLVDPSDACPTEPETVNQVKDEDGCPDRLGRVELVVQRDGAPATGATYQLKMGEEAKGSGSYAEAVSAEAKPGSSWTATAELGPCLAGEGQVVATEGEARLVVELKPKNDATVKFEVVDAAGAFVKGATVAWSEDPSGCTPAGKFELPQGEGSQAVGVGSRQAMVTAPGFNTVAETVVTTSGKETVVRVVLKPTKVRMEAKQIAILEKVFFETSKDIIKPESHELLNEVAAVLQANPQVGKVEVAGHTDNQGADASNLDLSQRRAAAVVKYLVGRGVSAERLTPMGYGETKPIATNDTSTGRADNRRVEFNIVGDPALEKPAGAP